ncbi:MAG: HYR domain-containing protein [Phycisphaerae bacterium]|nr:HYR domain-containing protein [Phycisphaerae bacterium]
MTYIWTWVGGTAQGITAIVTLPLGTTEVTLTVSDGQDSDSDTVRISIQDTTAPVLTVPDDKQAEQANLAGTAVDIGQASAEDICDADVEITNDAPPFFPLGQTTVTWTATDDSGNAATGTQIVTVVDTTVPVLTVPGDKQAEQANLAGTAVDVGQASAEDICDADIDITNDAPPFFPLGQTTVTWTATDDSGNTATGTQIVTVVDTTAPALTVPEDTQAEQANLAGTAVDIGQASAEDICDADIDITNDAPPFFPLGQTTVTWTATDDSGNAATGTQIVTVVDTTVPVLTVPGDKQAEQANLAGTAVDIGKASAEDICDSDVEIANDAPMIFPLGQTIVTWTATDDSGNAATGTQIVTVVDTTAPTVVSVSADPETLWPANHKMVEVTISVVAEDICDAEVECAILSVTSNEETDGPGDGNTEPDWEISGSLTVNLRAERSGSGEDRVYTITVACTDDSGNESTATVEVTVPHDKGKGGKKK